MLDYPRYLSLGTTLRSFAANRPVRGTRYLSVDDRADSSTYRVRELHTTNVQYISRCIRQAIRPRVFGLFGGFNGDDEVSYLSLQHPIDSFALLLLPSDPHCCRLNDALHKLTTTALVTRYCLQFLKRKSDPPYQWPTISHESPRAPRVNINLPECLECW